MTVNVIDQTRCPLCGGDNSCATVAGRDHCWCQVESIPPELLKKIPADLQHKACVCKSCVDAFNQQ